MDEGDENILALEENVLARLDVSGQLRVVLELRAGTTGVSAVVVDGVDDGNSKQTVLRSFSLAGLLFWLCQWHIISPPRTCLCKDLQAVKKSRRPVWPRSRQHRGRAPRGARARAAEALVQEQYVASGSPRALAPSPSASPHQVKKPARTGREQMCRGGSG